MLSNKGVSNTKFNKRTDFELKHSNRRNLHGPAVCEECGAVFVSGRWTFDKDVLNTDKFENIEPGKTICPACRQIKTGEPAGFVYLEGNFYLEHKEEINNLLKNEAKRTSQLNPLARIMQWQEAGDGLIVTTTNAHLAKHLGWSLKRAYDGTVRYDFSHENKSAKVYWRRD
jgi:hypothetical protein